MKTDSTTIFLCTIKLIRNKRIIKLYFFCVFVFQHSTSPVQTYSSHVAAVKAIAWSPHQHGLLASGGGTADRCIRFWNTLTSQPMQCVDTGTLYLNKIETYLYSIKISH